MKRLQIAANGAASYRVDEGKVVTLDLDKAFGFNGLGELAQKAVAFAIGHVLRNATAGKMENLDDAFKAAAERAASIEAGKWAAHKESGEAGESRASLLAQALATVMQCDPKDAAEFISSEIAKALEEKNIDPDAEKDDLTPEQQTERRKIANAVRKNIGSDPAVSIQMAKLKLAAQQEKLAATEKENEGKKSAFA